VRFKEPEGNGISFCEAAGVVRVQVISAVVGRKQLRGAGGVAQDRVQVHYGIKFVTAKNPSVDLLASCFALGSVEVDGRLFEKSVFECRIGRADDADAFFMSVGDQFAVARDDLFGINFFAGGSERESGKQDVVDAEAEDDVFNASLTERVAFETNEAGLAECRAKGAIRSFWAIAQQTVADDSFIQNADLPFPAGTFLQTPGEHVRPAPVGVGGRAVTVCE